MARRRIYLFCGSRSYLRLLARVGSIEYLTVGERPKGAAMAIVGGTEIHLPLGDMINCEEEQARLTKEVDKVEEELSRVQKKLGNPRFLGKAKEEVIQKEREKSPNTGETARPQPEPGAAWGNRGKEGTKRSWISSSVLRSSD